MTINKNVISACLAITTTISTFVPKISYGDQGQPAELIFSTQGLSANDEWWVTYNSISSIRWWEDHTITNNYSSGSSSHQNGDPRGDYGPGFEAPDNWNQQYAVVAYGYYQFTFHCPTNSNVDGKYFYLDLRDADWSTHYSPSNGDMYIKWNCDSNRFEYHNDQTTGYIDNGSNQEIWSLFNRDAANKDPFQPTPPTNFRCTNAGQIGQHPNFAWELPPQPTGVTFK